MTATHARNQKLGGRGNMLCRAGLLAAFIIGSLLALLGSTAPADERLRLVRDNFRAHKASGQIAVVEIDARSLKSISDWPWPRRIHADLIDKLRAAGARTIAFDVDFSATTNAADDAALAAALKRSEGAVVLPTFRQPVSEGNHVFTENMPIPGLRAHAFLGSVNVQPDRDGQLRNYSYGTVTAGIPRPSIAAHVADSRGSIGKSFRIDTAIDPTTIPRTSAIDVLNGKVAHLRGKAVLVGATAIEMGDRYVVPGHGVLPGVVVQALAAETLIQGTINPDIGPWPALVVTTFILAFAIPTRRFGTIATVMVTLLTTMTFVLEMADLGSFQIVPALITIFGTASVVTLVMLRRKLVESRMTDAATGLPNVRALERQCRELADVAIAVVRIPQFDEITAVLTETDRALLMTQIINRLSVGFPHVQVHAIESGILGWRDAEPLEQDQATAAGALFRVPIVLADRSVLITPVFGVSQGAGNNAAYLFARAKIAAKQAQAAGQRWAFESTTLSNEADRSIAIIADIESAISNGDIYVVYQAKWDVAAGRIAGAEALVRWHHPVFGPLSPDAFIPVLEANGQIHRLTLAVTDICTAQMAAWHADGYDLGLAINISAALLDNPDFIRAMSDRLERLSSMARHLTLEVTESATIASTKNAVAALTTFRSFGARVSIDDYGTGQATLAYLKSFPTDEIKIDKSFVTNMLDSNGDQIVVRSTIELAHELGFKVVAEGVEDVACLSRLTEFGCDTVQGWAIGKPVKADAFIDSVARSAISLAA
jgi:diguanylate cyclase